MPTPDEVTTSVDYIARPIDSRCRYWCKVVPAGTTIPLPGDADGAASIPGAYVKGEVTVFDGDAIFEGEANHHKKQRGWSFNVGVVESGKIRWLKASEAKNRLRKIGAATRDLLAGSGDHAAGLRALHAYRAGAYVCESAVAEPAVAEFTAVVVESSPSATKEAP